MSPRAGPAREEEVQRDAAVPETPSRREMLRGSALAFAALAGGCAKRRRATVACNDTTGLTLDVVALRDSAGVAYVDESTDDSKACDRCQQFVAGPSTATCGVCKVLRGPISPLGTCRLFVPRMS